MSEFEQTPTSPVEYPQHIRTVQEPLSRRADLGVDPDALAWQDEGAACKGANADQFFPKRGESEKVIQRAKDICAECIVQIACLDYAIENNETIGIWGGLTVEDRREYRREQERKAS